jgi:hypothetical protein
LFESVPPPDLPSRLRAAAIWPIAAVILAQIYDTALPFIGRGVPWLFWLVAFLQLAGLGEGLTRGIALLIKRRAEIDGRAVLSLLLLLGALILCTWTAAGMLAPGWL